MSEQKRLNENDLEKVAGGTGDSGFERAWAAYTSTHCGGCMWVSVGRETRCTSERVYAEQAYAAGLPVTCKAYEVEP